MHTLPFAAWAAIVGLLGGGALVDTADAPCEAPDCFTVTHGFLMRPPLMVVPSGKSVEWEVSSGTHWIVEAGTTGGCLSLALDADTPRERARFILDSEQLFAAYAKEGGGYDVVPCTSAVILPNGMAALRYGCALHQREGGFGFLLVEPPSGFGPGWEYLA